MSRHKVFRAMICAIIAALSMPLSPVEAKGRPGLEEVACWFDTTPDWPESNCFFMHVHEVHSDPESRLIKFPVVRFDGGDSESYPVLHLGGGGPGNAVGLSAAEITDGTWSNYFHMFHSYGRDLLIMDPRGVGMAEPRLICDEFIDRVRSVWAENLSYMEELEIYLQGDVQCRDRFLGDGHNLTTYNSATVAKDVEALRKALGVDKLFLYGVSYGSRYAQTIARDFPDSVAAMVLDGPVFPNVRTGDSAIRNYTLAIKRALDQCTSEIRCSAKFPDIEKRFWRLVNSLNERPVQMHISDPLSYRPLKIVINGDRFFDAIFFAIYDAGFREDLPPIVKSLEYGGTDLVSPVVRDYLSFLLDGSFADVVSATHYCYEEFPFEELSGSHIPEGPNQFLVQKKKNDAEYNKRICGLWQPEPKDNQIEGMVIRTSVPTLILQGELDPIIPIEDMNDQIGNFDTLVYYSYSDVAHGVISANICAEKVAGAFYNYGLAFSAYEDCMDSETAMELRFRTPTSK